MTDGNYQLLVFDWDGTLMDSVQQIVTCMHQAMRDLELAPATDDAVKNIIGLGLREAIDALLPGRDEAFHQRFVAQYREHWFAAEQGQSSLFDGAYDTLHELQARGYQLAVATGKGRPGLDKVLRETGLVDLFDATRCADETRSKPHPQMLNEILQTLEVLPHQALMIGDTEYDLEMASRAGAQRIGVTYGVHSPARLQRHDPLVLLDDIRELLDGLAQRSENGITLAI